MSPAFTCSSAGSITSTDVENHRDGQGRSTRPGMNIYSIGSHIKWAICSRPHEEPNLQTNQLSPSRMRHDISSRMSTLTWSSRSTRRVPELLSSSRHFCLRGLKIDTIQSCAKIILLKTCPHSHASTVAIIAMFWRLHISP